MNPDQLKTLQVLADRQEIYDCILRYCRAVDRLDREMMQSVYHPDAVDDHGVFVGNRDAFIDWAFAFHGENQISHHHMVFNHSVDLEGDTAHTETYWLYFGENRVKPNTLAVGRYVDRFEKRDGRWAIAARVCVTECINEVTETQMPEGFRGIKLIGGDNSRSTNDISYRRPLCARPPAGAH